LQSGVAEHVWLCIYCNERKSNRVWMGESVFEENSHTIIEVNECESVELRGDMSDDFTELYGLPGGRILSRDSAEGLAKSQIGIFQPWAENFGTRL